MFKNYKLIILLFTLLTLLQAMQSTSTIYAESTSFYAQIQSPNVYLYNDKLDTPIFEIPETFYVQLLENSVNGYYKAEYNGIVGYISENSIQCVSNAPSTPYLVNVSFRNYGNQSSELRSEPSRVGGTSTLICELPLYETNFEFIGKISGEEVVPNRSDIWYYCKYTKNNQTKIGYIYSGLVDMFSNYYSNPIDAYPITKHPWKIVTNSNPAANLSLPTHSQSLVILGISIPIIILLFALFRPVKNDNKRNEKQSNKKYDLTQKFDSPRYTTYNLQNMNNTKIYKLNRPQPHSNTARKHKRNKDYYELWYTIEK